jgi:hypothetical protein
MHSFVIHAFDEILGQWRNLQQTLTPQSTGQQLDSPWRMVRYHEQLCNLVIRLTDDLPLKDFPAALHRERHAAEVAVGSQNYDADEDKLASLAFGRWSAVEVACSIAALKRALYVLPWGAAETPENQKRGWDALRLILMGPEITKDQHYRFTVDLLACGSWIADALKARETADETPYQEIGEKHRLLMDASRAWLDELLEGFPEQLPQFDKDFALAWQEYSMQLRGLPSIKDLETEWVQKVMATGADGGSPFSPSSGSAAADEETYDPSQLVTLDQMAAMVGKKKRTLQLWQKNDKTFPLPEIEGGGGNAAYWQWQNVSAYLRKKSRNDKLPESFPSLPR